MRPMFTWPWCWGHNSPMVRGDGHTRWTCHFEGTPTKDGTEGCQATTIEFQWTGQPFDLTKPLKAER